MNPFSYVNSLYTYAQDVAIALGKGEDVVALIGPYDGNELIEHLEPIIGKGVKTRPCLSSREISSGGHWGLTLVSRLEEPLSSLRARCKDAGMTLLEAPRSLSSDELSGYGLALSMDSDLPRRGRSEIYRSTVLRLAAGMCAGSVACYRSIVEKYLKREGRVAAFGDPLELASEYGRTRAQGLKGKYTYVKDEMDTFLEWLASLALGAQVSESELQATYLWAWSLGFCWRMDGMWCIDWAIIMHAAELPKSDPLVEKGDVGRLMNSLGVRRVGLAETSAMMPVLERYCALAASKYVCESMRNEAMWSEGTELSRASQIGDVRKFQMQHPTKWPLYVRDNISILDVYLLRNNLCHLSPTKMTPQLLTTFQKVLGALTIREERRYTSDNSCVFM